MPPTYQRPELDTPPAPDLPGFRWLAALVVFIAALMLWMLLYPFNFQSERITGFLAERQFNQVHKINLLLNFLFFVPFGLVAGWTWKVMLWRRTWLIVLLVAADAAIISGLAELLQMWLPEPVRSVIDPADHTMRPITAAAKGRTSSLFDFLANTTGGTLGGALGLVLAPRLSHHWSRFGAWLSSHPRGRRALVVLAIVLLARTAPFDATIETSFLRAKLTYQTVPTGMPFSATKRWLLTGEWTHSALAATRREAIAELVRAGVNFILFAFLAAALTRAFQEARALRGKRASGARRALMLTLAIVIATELLQLPIRSRLMDATDPAAGAVGATLGVTLALMKRRVRPAASGR